MNKSQFSIFQQSQKVIVDTNRITGHFDGYNSVINIPLDITLTAERHLTFETMTLSANLELQNPRICLSSVSVPFGRNPRNGNTGLVLSFPLGQQHLQAIEKNRSGDLQLTANLELFYLTVKNTEDVESAGLTILGTAAATCFLPIHIPRSVWIERILNNLGYQALRIIEIPLSHKYLKEAYHGIIFEFNEAERYYNQRDYNQCVAHCRKTIDSLHTALRNLKDQFESDSLYIWLSKTEAATTQWIATLEWADQLDKKTFALTSKPHHIGKTNFTRVQAESIYLVVLSLLNVIGNTE